MAASQFANGLGSLKRLLGYCDHSRGCLQLSERRMVISYHTWLTRNCEDHDYSKR